MPPQEWHTPAPFEAGAEERAEQPAALAGTVLCGGCGEPLEHGPAPSVPAPSGVYGCPSGCRPPVPADALELRVGRAVMERMWTPRTLARMALAQELLDELRYDLRYRVPVSLKHALHQWEYEFDPDTRRALVREAMLAAVLFPAVRPGADDELFFAWRRAGAEGPGLRQVPPDGPAEAIQQ